MPSTKLQRVETILKLLNDNISKEDFVRSLNAVITQVRKMEAALLEKHNKNTQQLTAQAENILQEKQDEFNALKKETIQKLNEAFNEQTGALNFLARKVADLKDGKDADESKIITNVLAQIEVPEPHTAQQIRDLLETLKEKERLAISAIDNLEERLKELENRPLLGGRGGGGFSKAHMEGHLIDDELIGTGDGNTKDYTLDNTPAPPASLSIFVGSARMYVNDDFTLTGRSIAFFEKVPAGAKIRGSYRT